MSDIEPTSIPNVSPDTENTTDTNIKYYEIIVGTGNSKIVVGTTVGAILLDEILENEGCTVGEITEEQYNSYGDESWEHPISKKRFFPAIISRVDLVPIDVND